MWEITLSFIKDRVSPQHFTTWFKPLKVVRIEGNTVELEVPNRFFQEWICENYLDLIKEGLSKSGIKEPNISFKISSSMEKRRVKVHHEQHGVEQKKSKTTTPRTQIKLNPRYTFENFVVGKSNEFAHAACIAVANNPSRMYNPLFIYGGVGLGKTHLLQAIGNRILSTRTDLRVSYFSAETFMNELINSIRFERMPEFRKKFREIDVLLIDDIQFLAGKERTQEEFFHTFNALHGSHGQIVVTSDRFPKDIEGLEERLRTRFEWGLIADIHPPEMETKIAILKKKAELEGIDLPDDVAFYLAGIVESNIRELEGYLIRVTAYAFLTGRKITLDMAEEVLKNIVKDKEQIVTIEDIQKAVSKFFNIKVSELKSRKRLKNIALPRQIAMYLSREYTNASFPEIGNKFGGKDHSTVIHACKKIGKAVENDIELKNIIESIKALLNMG